MAYLDVEKQREYQRDWMRKRRAEYLRDKACVLCGSVDGLEVDHIDRSTKVSHRIWSWSLERREVELEKCQVLCRECHKQKCVSDGVIPHVRKHGTGAMYGRHRCRCVLCRGYNARKKQRQRGRKREREKGL